MSLSLDGVYEDFILLVSDDDEGCHHWMMETMMMMIFIDCLLAMVLLMVMAMIFCAGVAAGGDICRWRHCALPIGSAFAFDCGCGVGR